MKKNILFLLPAVLLAACGKSGSLTSENFAVSPTPLEYIAGEVPATISINVPAKVMNKKAIIECTPILKWDGGTIPGASYTLQGEKVEANNTIISYKNGGHATMRFSVPFVDGMEKSDLLMQFKATKGKKSVTMPTVKIGYGTQCTAALITKTAKTANFGVAPDDFQRVISQKQEAAVKFLIGQANLRGSELNSQNIKDFIATLKNIKSDEESLVLNNIEISAYASPDGAYAINEKLAEKRGATSEGYVNQQLKDNKLSTNIDTKYTAEDWEGFQALVSQSNLQDKNVILSVLSMYTDPEQREQEIRNIATVYKELADAVLPELRRARMVINYDVIGRSDEQILAQYSADATKLSIEELLYAANILSTNDSQRQDILKKTISLFPNDYRAYNNLGEIAMRLGDNDAAQNFFRQALSINSNAAEANTNMGMLAIQNSQFKDAEMYISKGTNANNFDEALGHLYLAQGKYSQATAKFSKSANNSAALACIMSQDYSDALKTLSNIKNPDAMTYYLRAILAARMEDKSEVKDNLAKAISLDGSLAKRAANDAEFSDYNK
ncbi:MAG: tetratricopeptide repeat protein [Prevotellaceae bacterium]|nr:tetratricopeptide repeat protein [Candidatus Minthosoma caballi]